MDRRESGAILAADTLEGERVLDADGREVGQIADLMIDVERGVVASAVIAFRGPAGEELRAVPWRALTLDPERRGFVLAAARGA